MLKKGEKTLAALSLAGLTASGITADGAPPKADIEGSMPPIARAQEKAAAQEGKPVHIEGTPWLKGNTNEIANIKLAPIAGLQGSLEALIKDPKAVEQWKNVSPLKQQLAEAREVIKATIGAGGDGPVLTEPIRRMTSMLHLLEEREKQVATLKQLLARDTGPDPMPQGPKLPFFSGPPAPKPEKTISQQMAEKDLNNFRPQFERDTGKFSAAFNTEVKSLAVELQVVEGYVRRHLP